MPIKEVYNVSKKVLLLQWVYTYKYIKNGYLFKGKG